MGGMGLIFTPALVRHLLGPLAIGLSGPMINTSWTHSWNVKKVAQPSSVSQLATYSYKHQTKDYSSYTENLVWLQSSTREP